MDEPLAMTILEYEGPQSRRSFVVERPCFYLENCERSVDVLRAEQRQDALEVGCRQRRELAQGLHDVSLLARGWPTG